LKTTIQKFLHEPLVHFLIFGGCIYIYYQIISPNQVETAQAFQKQKVVLNKEEIAKLQQDYEQEFHKTPNPTILTLLQQQLYRKKVLLKEAYALQLYKNDKKIDALLLQKIDFILQKQESAKDIDESDLQKYYHKHIQDYSHRKSISFLHIHFANLTQKEQNKIYKLLQYAPKLKGVEKEIKRDKESLQKEYGNYFTQKLFRAKKGEWLPPIPTKKGYESVYILNYETGKPYPFEEVEDRVYKDFKSEQERKNHHQQMQKIMQRYELYKEQ